MRNAGFFIGAGLSIFALGAFAAPPVDSVERKPLVVGTKIETGQIVQGSTVAGQDPDDHYLSQIGVSLTQEVIVNRRLNLRVGAGGVFYSVFPAIPNALGTTLGVKFGPGITQAQAQYKFGSDPEKPWGSLRIGYFPYKYNSDARNLGEYLFRAGAYPSYVFTGGWSITDNALVKPQGIEFSLSHFNGALKQSFMLANERDFRPQGDFTPSYVVEYTRGPFQVGGGVAFYHYFPIKDERTNPKTLKTAYYVFDKLPAFDAVNPLTGDTAHFEANQRIVASYGDVTSIITPSLNPAWENGSTDSLFAYHPPSTTGHYETKAIKLMGRGSFSIQKIAPITFLNPQDLKVYAEIALLGVKNYPGLYENQMDRMPMMMGINLPTFKLLDALSIEVEYLRNSNPDDFGLQQLWEVPTYYSNTPNTDNQTNGGGGLAVKSEGLGKPGYTIMFRDSDMNHRDDWKWSVYAIKQLITGVSLRAQVANDHFRAQDANVNGYWTAPALTRTPEDWYYILSVNFGI